MKLRVCPVCSKEFRVTEWEYKLNLHTFCTNSCRKMFLRTMVECLRCKKTFTAYKSRTNIGRSKYCSVDCARSVWREYWSKEISKRKK
jgi:hypothetical protein